MSRLINISKIALICIFLSNDSFAKDIIDVELDKCLSLDTGQTTAGMIHCTQRAFDAWDAELNRVYKELLTRVEEDAKKSLVDSQRAWIKHRNSEFELIDKIAASQQGTMYAPMFLNRKLQVVKNRVIELRGLNDIMKME